MRTRTFWIAARRVRFCIVWGSFFVIEIDCDDFIKQIIYGFAAYFIWLDYANNQDEII